MDPTKHDVAIFWDFENCRPGSQSSGHDVADAIRALAHTFGTVKVFKAYLDISEQCLPFPSYSTKSSTLRSQLQLSGVSLTDCPHNGQKNVADIMMIVDMMAYAMDASPATTTLIIITADRDFAYVLSVLRLRRFPIVLITKDSAIASLRSRASVCYDWDADILGKEPSSDSAKQGSESSSRIYSKRSSSFSIPSASTVVRRGSDTSDDGVARYDVNAVWDQAKQKSRTTHRPTPSESDTTPFASGFSPASFLVGGNKQLTPPSWTKTLDEKETLQNGSEDTREPPVTTRTIETGLDTPRGDAPYLPPSAKVADDRGLPQSMDCDTQPQGAQLSNTIKQSSLTDQPEAILVHRSVQEKAHTPLSIPLFLNSLSRTSSGEAVERSPSVISVDSLTDDDPSDECIKPCPSANKSNSPLPPTTMPLSSALPAISEPVSHEYSPSASPQLPTTMAYLPVQALQLNAHVNGDSASQYNGDHSSSSSTNDLLTIKSEVRARDLQSDMPTFPASSSVASGSSNYVTPMSMSLTSAKELTWPELQPLPKGLLPVITVLERLQQRGNSLPLRTIVETEVMQLDSSILTEAGVKTFPQYCALAESSRVLRLSQKSGAVRVTLNDWNNIYVDPRKEKSIRTSQHHTSTLPSSLTASLRSTTTTVSTSINSALSVPILKELPPGMLALIEILERYNIEENEEKPLFSKVAVDLVKKNRDVYTQANVRRFKPYCAVAEAAGIVRLGDTAGKPGTEWMMLLDWRKKYRDPRPSMAQPLTNASRFQPLILCLEDYRKMGVKTPLSSSVAMDLHPQANLVYQQAGATSFAQYSELAAQANIVVLGGMAGSAWIAFRPEWYAKHHHSLQ